MLSGRALLTVAQVAREFRVHGGTVRSWIKRGLITAIRTPGGQYRVDRLDVERVLGTSAADASLSEGAG